MRSLVILRGTIEAIGTGNLGINLDLVNLILRRNGNPIDTLAIFVRGIHTKWIILLSGSS